MTAPALSPPSGWQIACTLGDGGGGQSKQTEFPRVRYTRSQPCLHAFLRGLSGRLGHDDKGGHAAAAAGEARRRMTTWSQCRHTKPQPTLEASRRARKKLY